METQKVKSKIYPLQIFTKEDAIKAMEKVILDLYSEYELIEILCFEHNENLRIESHCFDTCYLDNISFNTDFTKQDLI